MTVTERRKNLLRGLVTEVLEPSTLRIDPPCPYFGPCGGCHRDHQGRDFSLVHLADADCTSCHRDLKTHMNGTPQFHNAIKLWPATVAILDHEKLAALVQDHHEPDDWS